MSAGMGLGVSGPITGTVTLTPQLARSRPLGQEPCMSISLKQRLALSRAAASFTVSLIYILAALLPSLSNR